MTGNHVARPEVTGSDLEVTHLTGSTLEIDVEGRKLMFSVRWSTYRVITRRKWQSRDRK